MKSSAIRARWEAQTVWRRMFGRRDSQQGAQADSQTQPAEQSARSQTPTVTLRPMTEAEYEHLRSWLDEDYAQDVAKAMGVSIEEGREAAPEAARRATSQWTEQRGPPLLEDHHGGWRMRSAICGCWSSQRKSALSSTSSALTRRIEARAMVARRCRRSKSSCEADGSEPYRPQRLRRQRHRD